jgi:hypothetical protein
MDQVVDQSAQEALTRRGDWTSVGRQRGFRGDVRSLPGRGARDGRRLSALDALETHRLCETVVRELGGEEPAFRQALWRSTARPRPPGVAPARRNSLPSAKNRPFSSTR